MTNHRLENARHWDAGEAGCGEFVAGLKRELARIAPGSLLQLTTRNVGAPTDLPAWCRMTGHRLVHANHPTYVVEKGGR